jgi:hypothetical protein
VRCMAWRVTSAVQPAAAAAAVQGHAFRWDKDSIVIQHAQNCVQFTGTWAANGERYRVVMLPGQIGPGGVRGQLQVGAQHICSSSSSGQQKTDLQGRICTQVLLPFFLQLLFIIVCVVLVLLPGQIGPRGVRGQLQVGAQHICSSSSSSSSCEQQAVQKTDLQGRM